MLLEIQGLRGMAIIAVLLFHLWPEVFPNGYVGVDMFFVISGFLMSMIFEKYSVLSLKNVFDFYYKRAKRILPLYYMVLPLAFLAGHLFLTTGWIQSTNDFAIYSFILLKNMKTIWDGSNYFVSFLSTIHQKDIFLHLWSLTLEIQFYLIVPFVFLGLQFLEKKRTKAIVLLIMCSISCGQYYYSNPIFSFNYFLSRFWQFGLGMVAHIYNKNNVEILPKNNDATSTAIEKMNAINTACAVFPLLLIGSPQVVPPELMRPLATFSCFMLLFQCTEFSRCILTHKWLTYTGDLSYSLYLIHWPIITLFSEYHSIQFIVGLVLLLSFLSYSYYESMYRKMSVINTLCLLATLVIANILIFFTCTRCPYIHTKLEEFRYRKVAPSSMEALLQNVEYSRYPALHSKGDYNESSPLIHSALTPPWGIWDFSKGNGTRKVMVIGNSYALNEANMINEEFFGNYSQFKLITGLALVVLYDFWKPPAKHVGQHEEALKLVEDFKPDILFIVARLDSDFNLIDYRFDDNQKSEIRNKNIAEDSLVNQFNQNIARLEKACGKILIHGPTPLAPLLHLNTFIDAIIAGKPLDRFNLKKNVVDKETSSIDSRLNSINCSRCHIYDIRPALRENNLYLTFDPNKNLSFFDNDIHFTLAGLERIRPVYRDLIRQM